MPCPPSPLVTATLSKNLRCLERKWCGDAQCIGESRLYWNRRQGIFQRLGLACMVLVLMLGCVCVCVCVCVHCIYVSVYDMSDGHRILQPEMNRKTNQSIRCYFSDDVLVHLGEKPLSHSYAIFQFPPPPFTSDSELFSISLTDFFSFIQEPQGPISGSR